MKISQDRLSSEKKSKKEVSDGGHEISKRSFPTYHKHQDVDRHYLVDDVVI